MGSSWRGPLGTRLNNNASRNSFDGSFNRVGNAPRRVTNRVGNAPRQLTSCVDTALSYEPLLARPVGDAVKQHGSINAC